MKNIQIDAVTETVARLCQEANYYLGEDVISDWSCAERHMEEINRIHNLALDCIEIFD